MCQPSVTPMLPGPFENTQQAHCWGTAGVQLKLTALNLMFYTSLTNTLLVLNAHSK